MKVLKNKKTGKFAGLSSSEYNEIDLFDYIADDNHSPYIFPDWVNHNDLFMDTFSRKNIHKKLQNYEMVSVKLVEVQ